MYNLEHIGGPLHLRRAVAPEGHSRGYTLRWPIARPVVYQADSDEPAALPLEQELFMVEVHYSLRTVVLNGWVVWVGYVDDDYHWDGWPAGEMR